MHARQLRLLPPGSLCSKAHASLPTCLRTADEEAQDPQAAQGQQAQSEQDLRVQHMPYAAVGVYFEGLRMRPKQGRCANTGFVRVP